MDGKRIEARNLQGRLSDRDLALFRGLKESDADRFFTYLFSVPKQPDGVPGLRSQAIGLYDPFCDRRKHTLGILWQCAPYSYCSHGCAYCYGRSYLHRFGDGPAVKKGFRKAFERSLSAMKALNLPPRHLSMANSTDVLQEKLEREHCHTLFMLTRLVDFRDLFSSFCMLTKNPGMLLEDPAYLRAIRELGLEVQVSIAFWGDEAGKRLEPGAPLVSERRMAVEKLVQFGIRTALRMDPLFPRGVQGCTEYQNLEEDLAPLISWAAQTGIEYVISSPLKLVFRRNTISWFNESLVKAFPLVRGGYRRMPDRLQKKLLDDVRALCGRYGLPLEHCFANILKRNPAVHEQRTGGL